VGDDIFPYTLALIARRMKALLLSEPNRRVRCSDAEDPRMVHWLPADSCEQSVWLS
jgi:hypothetical protein